MRSSILHGVKAADKARTMHARVGVIAWLADSKQLVVARRVRLMSLLFDVTGSEFRFFRFNSLVRIDGMDRALPAKFAAASQQPIVW